MMWHPGEFVHLINKKACVEYLCVCVWGWEWWCKAGDKALGQSMIRNFVTSMGIIINNKEYTPQLKSGLRKGNLPVCLDSMGENKKSCLWAGMTIQSSVTEQLTHKDVVC